MAAWLGVTCYAALAWTLAQATWQRWTVHGLACVPLAAGVVLVSEDFHEWATGGLETMLFTWLATAVLKPSLPFIQALLLMGIYMLMPFVMVFSSYSLLTLIHGGIAIFTIKMWSVLWFVTDFLDDKLALVTRGRPRIAVLNAGDSRLGALDVPEGTRVAWFNHGDGWHLRDTIVHRGERAVVDARHLPLPGRHNGLNLCAALAAIEALGHDAVALAPHAASFRPLPHRR